MYNYSTQLAPTAGVVIQHRGHLLLLLSWTILSPSHTHTHHGSHFVIALGSIHPNPHSIVWPSYQPLSRLKKSNNFIFKHFFLSLSSRWLHWIVYLMATSIITKTTNLHLLSEWMGQWRWQNKQGCDAPTTAVGRCTMDEGSQATCTRWPRASWELYVAHHYALPVEIHTHTPIMTTTLTPLT